MLKIYPLRVVNFNKNYYRICIISSVETQSTLLFICFCFLIHNFKSGALKMLAKRSKNSVSILI